MVKALGIPRARKLTESMTQMATASGSLGGEDATPAGDGDAGSDAGGDTPGAEEDVVEADYEIVDEDK